MPLDRYFGLYHETFHMRGHWEIIFSYGGVQGRLNRLTSFSALGENVAHVSYDFINTGPDSTISRAPRSPLHLVSGSNEEASRRWQAVRPLHLSKVRLPAHDKDRPKTAQPFALKPGRLVYSVCLVCLAEQN